MFTWHETGISIRCLPPPRSRNPCVIGNHCEPCWGQRQCLLRWGRVASWPSDRIFDRNLVESKFTEECFQDVCSFCQLHSFQVATCSIYERITVGYGPQLNTLKMGLQFLQLVGYKCFNMFYIYMCIYIYIHISHLNGVLLTCYNCVSLGFIYLIVWLLSWSKIGLYTTTRKCRGALCPDYGDVCRGGVRVVKTQCLMVQDGAPYLTTRWKPKWKPLENVGSMGFVADWC